MSDMRAFIKVMVYIIWNQGTRPDKNQDRALRREEEKKFARDILERIHAYRDNAVREALMLQAQAFKREAKRYQPKKKAASAV